LQLTLRPNEPAVRAPEYHAFCRPERRKLVVSLRAEHGPRIPVRYLGQVIARTYRAAVDSE
jgi:hypothetical protein